MEFFSSAPTFQPVYLLAVEYLGKLFERCDYPLVALANPKVRPTVQT
jgi:hypothetical protein